MVTLKASSCPVICSFEFRGGAGARRGFWFCMYDCISWLCNRLFTGSTWSTLEFVLVCDAWSTEAETLCDDIT